VRWGVVAAVQHEAVDLVGGRLGRRCSPFAVWIWLVSRRAGNYALRREEVRTENVGWSDNHGRRIIRLIPFTNTRYDPRIRSPLPSRTSSPVSPAAR
jgi:hypothetical protein